MQNMNLSPNMENTTF